jgi:hypothetical protein
VVRNTTADVEAQSTWDRARRALFWANLGTYLGRKGADLLDFNEVSHRLKLRNAVYRGTQIIPLNKIVGSTGRYNDFTRTFLPKRTNLSERWRGVAAVALDGHGMGLPPIEVYKAGEWYFVRDGNHRVSVARQLGNKSIEAYVWEYTDALPPYRPDANIEELLIEAERIEFFEQTALDKLRPGCNIRINSAGGYTELLVYIANYRDVLSKIDETDMSYSEAVAAWYDMIYEPSEQLINDCGILRQFPNATATDLFVWVMQHRAELQARYGGNVLVGDAAQGYTLEHPRSVLGWLRFLLMRIGQLVRRMKPR